jgi:hypothetical protein
MSDSVAPNESVSSTGRKTSKPGKRERQQARSAVGSAGGKPASSYKASLFAAGGGDPVPQPGKFPVVFATGAGEPSRDQEFAYSPAVLAPLVSALPGRFIHSPAYAEFRTNADITDEQFRNQLSAAFVLRLAQQTVHAHVNLGLPQGDFAPVASSDVRLHSSLSAVVAQFGEYSSPSLGTRYLLCDYEATVKRLVFAASQIWRSGPNGALGRSWLPMSPRDGVTRLSIASGVNHFLSPLGLSFGAGVLEEHLLSGTIPDVWEDIKNVFGDPPAEGQRDIRDRFDFLFKSYADVSQFTTAFSTAESTAALLELGLVWQSPSAGHLDWQFNAKAVFSSLSESWARVSAAYAKFFEMSSGLSVRSSASGSAAQMAEVTSVDMVTVVKTMVALSAPEFSLVACFPASAIFSGPIDRRVVVTTPLSVKQRATEFCQQDWRV